MNTLIYLLKKKFFKLNGDQEYNYIKNVDNNIINNMKQDGILILDNTTDNINIIVYNNLNYLTINDKLLLRINKPYEIAWLKNNIIEFSKSSDNIYYRCLNDFHDNDLISVISTYKNNININQNRNLTNCHHIILNILNQTNSKDKVFIEYGVSLGDLTCVVSNFVKKVYCVDINNYSVINENVFFYKKTTDQFSLENLPNIDFDYAFIDACHDSNYSFRDFENIYNKINKGGYIFLHDTYPSIEENLKPSACNDCYLTIFKIKEKYPNIEYINLPINPGICIVRK